MTDDRTESMGTAKEWRSEIGTASDENRKPTKWPGISAALAESPVVHNFKGTKQEIWRKLALCQGSTCRGHDAQPKEGIDVQNFFCHRIELVNERTGEIANPIRVCLVTPANEVYAFTSDYLASDIDAMIATFGTDEWSPPIKLRVNQTKTRKGFSVFTIDPM